MLSRSNLKAFTVALVLLLAGSSAFPQKTRSPRVPSFVYGTWTIYRFIEVGGHAPQTKGAQAQIGKTLKIQVQTFDHDKDLLWSDNAPCKNVNYRMKVNADALDSGVLGFYGLEEADKDQFVLVSCEKRDLHVFELAKNQELAVYYDGWFFFLRKTKAISN